MSVAEIVIHGNVKRGSRVASGLNPDPNLKLNNTIFLQKPFFRNAGIPGVDAWFDGTINMDIAPKQFQIRKPHYEVTCEWTPNVVEKFWFVACTVDFKRRLYNAYIYYPCPSPVKAHANDTVELLTEKIDGLDYGDPITIRTRPDSITFSPAPRP